MENSRDKREQRGQVTVLRAMQFANFAVLALLINYFPLYFEHIGFSKLQIGAIYAVGPLLTIVSNIVVGLVSDRTKSLRRMLTLLYVGQLAALALLLPQREFAVISAIMALFYLFQTPVGPMTESITLLAANRLGRSFPAIRMFGSLGYALSAVAFGYLLKATGSQTTLTVGLAVLAAGLALTLFLGDYQATLRKFEFRGLVALLRKRETLLLFVMLGLVAVAHKINEAFLSVAMHEHGASGALIGYASLASSFSEIPVFFLLSKYGQRFRELPLLAIASLMYFVRLLLLSFATEPWMFVALQTMHAVTFAIYYVTAQRCLQTLLPDEYRSSSQAVFFVVWVGCAGLIAGLVGGWLYDASGLAATYLTGAGFAIAGCCGFLLMARRQ